MKSQKSNLRDPVFLRIVDDETAEYVFRFAVKYFYIFAGIQLFISVMNGFHLSRFISALLNLVLTVVFHKYRKRWVAITFFIISGFNFVIMATRTTVEVDALMFQFLIIAICVRAFQASSYFQEKEQLSI